MTNAAEHIQVKEIQTPAEVRALLFILGNRDLVGVAVGRAGAAEDEPLHAGIGHRFQDADRRRHVVLVIEQRLFDGLADVCIRREVHDRVDLMAVQSLGESRLVIQVREDGRNLEDVGRGLVTAREIVIDHWPMPGFLKPLDRVRSDVTRAACNQYVHSLSSLVCKAQYKRS